MRLEELGKNQSGQNAVIAKVSIGGAAPALVSDSERRSVDIIAPAGVLRLPKIGEEQLMIKTDEGSFAVLGLCADEIPEDLEAGDILIKNGEASICLRSDGRVEILGTLIINGSEQNGTQA